MSDAPGVFDAGEIALMREAYRRAALELRETPTDAFPRVRSCDAQLAVNILRELARGETDISVIVKRATESLLQNNEPTPRLAQSPRKAAATKLQSTRHCSSHAV